MKKGVTALETSKAQMKAPNWRSLKVLLPLAVVIVLLIGGSFFWLGYLYSGPWPYGHHLTIEQVVFGSNGTVTLHLWNRDTSNITVIQARVWLNSTTEAGPIQLVSGITVPAGGRVSLTITFPNVTWVLGNRYVFTLTDSNGEKYLADVTA